MKAYFLQDGCLAINWTPLKAEANNEAGLIHYRRRLQDMSEITDHDQNCDDMYVWVEYVADKSTPFESFKQIIS